MSAAPPGALAPLVAALRALQIPAEELPGRWAIRLGPRIPAWSLAELAGPPVPVALDPHRYRPIVELCRLAAGGHPPPFHPQLRSAAVARTEALEAGDPMDLPGRPLRLGPRLVVEPALRLGGGRASALPLLHLARLPLPAALAGWAERRPRLDADDPAGLLLAPPGPSALRIGARLQRLAPDDADGLLLAALPTPLAPGARRVGSGLLHVHVDALSVRPLRREAPEALRQALAAAERAEDLHDANHALEVWAAADPRGRAWPALRAVTGPAGQPLTAADWPRGPAALPPADLFDVQLPNGERARVWADALLDVLDRVGRPVPGTWPPRIGVEGPLPAEAEARARAEAIPAR